MENLDNLTENSTAFRPKKKVTFNSISDESYLTKESFKALRTNVIFCGADIKSLVITSANEGDGKSTVATELAKSFADSNKRTLLIDADMRKSVMLKKNLTGEEIAGLSEVLAGQADGLDVIYRTQEENFDVMFTGHFPPNPAELLSDSRLKDLITKLKTIYDYIIIDSPPLGLVVDAAVIASVADAAAIVIARNKTTVKSALAVKSQLEKSGTRIIGAIINEIDKQSALHRGKNYNSSQSYY